MSAGSTKLKWVNVKQIINILNIHKKIFFEIYIFSVKENRLCENTDDFGDETSLKF